MNAWQQLPLRTRIAVLASFLTALSAVATALLVPEVGPVAGIVVGVFSAGVTGAIAWLILSPLGQLSNLAQGVISGEFDPSTFPDGSGELASLAEAIRHLEKLRSMVASAHQTDLEAIASATQMLSNPKVSTPTAPTLSDRLPQQVERVQSGFDALNREMSGLRQRLGVAFRILNSLPDAVVVTDAVGTIRFVNPAGEEIFGTTSAVAVGKSLASLLTEPVLQQTNSDPDRELSSSASILEWIRGDATGSRSVRTTADRLVELSAAASRRTPKDVLICLVGRDLTAARQLEAEMRATIRANATRKMFERYLSESEESLRLIAAQHRLLLADAKQTTLREAMTGKLNALESGLKRLETYHMNAFWFRAALWSGLPAPTPSEFMAVEIVKLVEARLSGRLKSRGNTLKLIDQGGWLFAEMDRLEAALNGILTHACDSSTNAQIEVRINRLPSSSSQTGPMTEYYLPDAGPALASQMYAVIDQPFGGLAPSQLDRFEGDEGCPIGLAVAAWLAASMDGDLLLEPTGSQLAIRLTVPTRLAAENSAPVPMSVLGMQDVAPHDEMVVGWRLGSPSA